MSSTIFDHFFLRKSLKNNSLFSNKVIKRSTCACKSLLKSKNVNRANLSQLDLIKHFKTQFMKYFKNFAIINTKTITTVMASKLGRRKFPKTVPTCDFVPTCQVQQVFWYFIFFVNPHPLDAV